ncbi:MAG: ferredoxin family protein [Bacillota bacterium]|nr:ferredoxin family protein [Bacillota bacterium]
MSIIINQQSCISCGKCVAICPGNILGKSDTGKAYVKYPKDCWGCTSCLKECKTGAIKYYLGADIGGRGGYLYTKREKEQLYWFICKPDGEHVCITVDGTQANRY